MKNDFLQIYEEGETRAEEQYQEPDLTDIPGSEESGEEESREAA